MPRFENLCECGRKKVGGAIVCSTCYAARKIPAPLERLRYHVTGAIERGEAEPIVERKA